MMVHPYHFRLIKYMIRIQLKGNHHSLLSCADRWEYRKAHGLTLSEAYIKKVLRENGPPPDRLSQHTMDQLVKGLGYCNWNEFARTNPLPEGLPLVVKSKKMDRRVEELVLQRLTKRPGIQLELHFE